MLLQRLPQDCIYEIISRFDLSTYRIFRITSKENNDQYSTKNIYYHVDMECILLNSWKKYIITNMTILLNNQNKLSLTDQIVNIDRIFSFVIYNKYIISLWKILTNSVIGKFFEYIDDDRICDTLIKYTHDMLFFMNRCDEEYYDNFTIHWCTK